MLLIPGQSFASIGPGRIVSLPAPVQRDRSAWQVPVEFVARAVAPALDIRIELRRPTHVDSGRRRATAARHRPASIGRDPTAG